MYSNRSNQHNNACCTQSVSSNTIALKPHHPTCNLVMPIPQTTLTPIHHPTHHTPPQFSHTFPFTHPLTHHTHHSHRIASPTRNSLSSIPIHLAPLSSTLYTHFILASHEKHKHRCTRDVVKSRQKKPNKQTKKQRNQGATIAQYS